MAEETEQAKTPEQPKLENARDESFENFYANNIQFESTLWDLRMFFGQVDLATQKIVQHTAMNIPWPQAKIAAYYMVVNLVINQAMNGIVFLPEFVIPPRPKPSDPAAQQFGPRTIEYLGWIHDQVFGPNPYIPPAVAAYDTPKAKD